MEYKGYRILTDRVFGMKYIERIGTGALPKRLRGTFTSPAQAMIAIDGTMKHAETNNS